MNPNKHLALLSILGMACLSQAQSEFFETGPFDVGRAQTNQTVDGPRSDIPAWWNGLAGDVHCNVGWNTNGIWWSYILFGAPPLPAYVDDQGNSTKENRNPELFEKIAAADEIHIHLGVAWLESNGDLPVDPGVVVTAYLVPGMIVPEGSLGGWDFTWIKGTPANPDVSINGYSTIEMFDIDPAVYPPLAVSGTEYRVGLGFPPEGPSEADKRDHLTRFNITSHVKTAISQGLLDATTPWGIVLYPKGADPLTASDPQWISLQQTIIEGDYVILETVTNEAPTWAGYPMDEQGYVDTGTFLGWINASAGDWVWSYRLSKYLFLPEESVGTGGGWAYFP
jgi:hypothetical protein